MSETDSRRGAPSRYPNRAKTGPRRLVLPESTPVPNVFFDKIMPAVSHAEWKVLLFIWRKTIGWDKEQDFISLTQIEKGAGVCRDVAISGARLCEWLGLCTRSRSGYRGTKEYEIVLGYDKQEVISRLERLVDGDDWSSRPASNSRSSPAPLVEPIDAQKAPSGEASMQKATGPPLSYSGKKNARTKFCEIPTL